MAPQGAPCCCLGLNLNSFPSALGTSGAIRWVVQHPRRKAGPGVLGAVKSLEQEVSFSTPPLGQPGQPEGTPSGESSHCLLPRRAFANPGQLGAVTFKCFPGNQLLLPGPLRPSRGSQLRGFAYSWFPCKGTVPGRAQGSLGWMWGQAVARAVTRRPPSSCGCSCSSGPT